MKMKTSAFDTFAAMTCAALLAGCLTPRYMTLAEEFPKENAGDDMTLEEASKIVRETLETAPADRRPSHPGDRNLGKYPTSIRLRKNDRTELVLVEVKMGRRVLMEFYVPTQEDGEKFAAAVWRLRREYRGK
jgi:hypothetical protein